jgi:hypothetical protein
VNRFLLPPTAAAALLAAAAAPAAAPPPSRPTISLSATPAHLTLLGRIPQTLLVHNDGAARMQVNAQPASFAFDLYGNAAIAPRSAPPRSAHTWLVVRPRHVVLAPGQDAFLHVAARPPRGASPGDHHALVLLSTAAPRRARFAIRTRLGVLVLVRVPGRIVRRVVLGKIWLARVRGKRYVAVTAVNRGNVAERLPAGALLVTLRRARRVLASTRSLPRDLLPHTRGLLFATVRGRLRGRVTVLVRLAPQPGWTTGPSAPALRGAARTVRLRL